VTAQVLEIPLVGGPADGQTVRCVVGPDGRPPLTHPHGDGLAHAATYELTSDKQAECGWRYVYRPRSENGDFAPEHQSATFSDQMPGGPEGLREDGSPRGLSGAD
jgi:hypothetical protein